MKKGSLKLNIDFVQGKQKTIFGKERIVEKREVYFSEFSEMTLVKIM